MGPGLLAGAHQLEVFHRRRGQVGLLKLHAGLGLGPGVLAGPWLGVSPLLGISLSLLHPTVRT